MKIYIETDFLIVASSFSNSACPLLNYSPFVFGIPRKTTHSLQINHYKKKTQ